MVQVHQMIAVAPVSGTAMQRMKPVATIGLLIVAGAAGVGLIACRLDVKSPTTITAQSGAVDVVGEYYALDMDHVDEVLSQGERVVIRGFRLKNRGLGKVFQTTPAETVRPLPDDYRGTRAPPRWALVRSEFQEDTQRHTFANAESREAFSIALPRGSEALHYQAIRGRTGDVLVFAAGDWKVGPPSFYGYVLIRSRVDTSPDSGGSRN